MSLSSLFSVVHKKPFHPAGRMERRTFAMQSTERSALLYGRGGPYRAAFILLHGSQANGEKMRAHSGYAFDRLADHEACVIAYPNGYRNHWNDGRRNARFAAARENVDDVGFLRMLAASLCDAYSLQSDSVYLVGFSNGGHLIYRLLSAMPELLGGAVIIGANRSAPGHATFQLNRLRHPLLLVAGDRDPINPFYGGKTTLFGLGYRGNVLSAEESAADLARLASRKLPAGWVAGKELPHDMALSTTDYPCEGTAHVRLLALHGAGHTIPQPYAQMPRILGKTADGIDIARYAWDYFGLSSASAIH